MPALTPALTPGRSQRSPAVVGTALVTLGLIAVNLGISALPAPTVPPLLVHIAGTEAPGWYAANTPGAALTAAGADVKFLGATPEDGDYIEVIGRYALVHDQQAPVAFQATGAKLHLNGASLAELEALPKVGPALARRIRDGRPYRTLHDLDRVKGIGPKTLAVLAPYVEP